MMTLTEENYLKALFHLSTENEEVSVLDLSKSLTIKMPTVNSMVKKLSGKGLISYEKYKPLMLTQSGRRAAGLIIRKHRLVEMFLVQHLGFGWDEVHEIAEQIEHIKSQRFFDRIDQLLDFPKVDPHGSPIPDINGDIAVQNYMKLEECAEKQIAMFMSVGSSQDSFLKLIDKLNLKLGDKVEILEIQDFDKTMRVLVNDASEKTLSQMVAANILVQLTV
ncbi:metal-dependent transcriptional regulator [Lacihabitans sp. CCS-44]|uniref:metal-dependent transcriptional regulator n=1 Tax=Lacihabitans sp. CCS-44 TaxID=2487331 RepID=UPI0020CFD402|nr:metal-dependent transcriptional regulator [Lacihabitans sp. CCS-44]MCP9755626.1 metal-dependent transcriptional regulator [Lacihabitans sp. CCS-44]